MRRRAGTPGAAGAAVARRRAAAGATGEMAARRAVAAELAARRRAALDATGDGATGDGAAQLSPADASGSGPVRRRPGTTGPAGLPGRDQRPSTEVPAGARTIDADEPPQPATFVGVLRFIALGAHLVLAATFVWFVVEARSASTSARDGILGASRLDRLDLARTANVVALVMTVLLIGAWGSAIAMLARRSERPGPPPWLVVAVCVPATVLTVAGLGLDGRVGEGILFTLAVLAAGLGGAASLVLLSTMARVVVDEGSHGMQIWAAVIAVVGLGLTIGGYLDAIGPGSSLDTLTLVAILTSILVGLAVLLGAPASGALEDAAEDRPLVDADRNG